MQPDGLIDSDDYQAAAAAEADAEAKAEAQWEGACIQACNNYNTVNDVMRTGPEYLCLCGYHRDGLDDRITEEHRVWLGNEARRIIVEAKRERQSVLQGGDF